MKLIGVGAFVGCVVAQTPADDSVGDTNWYTDWFNNDYDWNEIDGDYDSDSYQYNLGDFYNFDYSYLFDNSTDYDSLFPSWDYSDYDYDADFANDDWDVTDENYDLADWKPWGDYPESGEDTTTDAGSNTEPQKPAENKPGPGGITADKIPTNVKCSTKYNAPPAKVLSRLAAKQPRIVGGDKVDLNTWGWYARLNIGGGGLCGATIIGQRWLLTASHCTVEGKTEVKPSDVTAYLNDYAANQKDKFERKITIKKVYNHPSYHSTPSGAPRNDITLLETNEDLYGDNVKGNAAPACLPAKDTTTETMQGLKCFVAGFGTVEYQGDTSDFLKSIHVNVIKDDTCKSAYNEYDKRIEFCAGNR